MDASEISSMFGELRRAGGVFGAAQKSDFQKILAAGVKAGVDASTLPEYLEGVTSLTARAGGVAGGAVSALPYAQLLAMFEKSGAAGLKGARGASVLSALEQGFRSPGGGAEGMAVVMGSLGFGRVGGNVSYYQAKKMMQQGFQGPGGANYLKNLFDYVDTITGGGEEANLYLEGLMGGRLSLEQIETVRDALGKGASADQVSKMLGEMTMTELDVLKSIDNNMREFLRASKRAADIQKKDIQRGAEFADPLESIQSMLHQFLMTTMPVVKTTLEAINKALGFLIPGIEKMVKLLSGQEEDASILPSDTFYEATGRGYKLRSQAETTLKRLEEDPDSVSTRELRMAVISSLQARQAFREAYENPDFLHSLAEAIQQGAVAVGAMEETDADRVARRLQEDFSRAVAALDALADRMGRGDEVDPARITTERELISAMSALGISMPASPRARIDTTGGSP